MCYLNVPYENREPPEPSPRAFPRLAWAMPVDITALATNLEAYSNIDQQVNSLRLSHRFGPGPLAKLPQEILEMIIDEAQQLERRKLRPLWKKRSSCFQGKCILGQHYKSNGPGIEAIWDEIFSWVPNPDQDPRLNGYTEEEKIDMIQDHLESGFGQYGDYIRDLHQESIREWLDSVCLCKLTWKSSSKARNWRQLSDMLRTRFGLEMYIMHEFMSPELKAFVPQPSIVGDCSQYTSAFLTLVLDPAEERNSSRHLRSEINQTFVWQGNHTGFRQTINPSALVLSDKQRQRFARAMSALGLSPYYHFTELESLISQPSNNAALWEICRKQLPGRPAPLLIPQKSRAKKLKEYMREKNKELAGQSWPQLQLLATSDAVFPW